MNVLTRVRSVWNASTSRSNISFGVLFERRRDAGRLLDHRQLARALLLGLLNAALDVANRVEVLGELRAGRAGRARCCSRRPFASPNRECCVPSACRASRAAASVLSLAPNSRSNTARGLFSIGSGVVGVRQRNRVRVGAAVAGVARADELVRLERELERRELGLLAELARGDLVHRDAGLDVGALGLLRRARRSGTRRTRGRDRRRLRRPAASRLLLEAAQDEQLSRNGASGCRIGESSKPRPRRSASSPACSCRSARRRRRGAARRLAAVCAAR